jgi:hypothetical protein
VGKSDGERGKKKQHQKIGNKKKRKEGGGNKEGEREKNTFEKVKERKQ